MRIAASSQVLVKIPIFGPPGVDVTQYTAKIALVKPGTEPGALDWHASVGWQPGAECALLVGGSGQVYAPGDYMAFAQITAGSEIPVLPAGRVSIGLADT